MNAEIIHAPPLALTLLWEGPSLVSLNLHWSNSPGLDQETPDPSDYAKTLKARLADYVAGHKVDWGDLPPGSFDAAPLSDFARGVLSALHERIGSGQTITYGELAALAGRPGAARAVGSVMAHNPWPLIYPCHRVLGSGGKLTGFSGSGGLPLKEYLLKLEGASY